MPRSRPRRLLVALGIALSAAVAGGAVTAAAAPMHRAAPPRTAASAAPAGPALVLYDSTGSWGWLGSQYVTQLGALTGHLNSWVAHPVTGYQAGELNRYRAVVYLGSTYDEPIPKAFLTDVLATTRPVLWANDNIWQLTRQDGDFGKRYGFMWKGFDHSAIDRVVYRGVPLTRDASNDSGVMDEWVQDPGKVTVLATALRPDGTTLPWAVRSGNLTYVGEVPLSYTSESDRYLAFADLLYDLLAAAPQPRHDTVLAARHLGTDPDAAGLRAVVTDLYGRAPTLPALPTVKHGTR